MMSMEQRQQRVADAIVLERAVRVLARTPRGGYTAFWWLGIKDTLTEVAASMRKEGETGEPATWPAT
jgi:hypothetical protein